MVDKNEIGIIADETKPQAMLLQKEVCAKLCFLDLNTNPDLAKHVKVIVSIGGDGFFLHVAHQFLDYNVSFYGVNYGSLGFLLNQKCEMEDLVSNIQTSEKVKLKLLEAEIETDQETIKRYAINEVSLLRETGQIAKIRIFIDDKLRMEELFADGIVLSTAAGSTAYNFSLYGPIFLPDANVLSLCPVSPFRPRYWRGALISEFSKVTFEVLNSSKRPVIGTADFHSFKNVTRLTASLSETKSICLLFDKNMPLKEKILMEQFPLQNSPLNSFGT